MRIERFNVGWITAPGPIWRRGEDPERRVRIPVPAYLIETAGERVLVDTGLHRDAVDDPAGYYGRPEAGLFELELDVDITAQVDVRSLTAVVLTHLHFDHAGAIGVLPDSVPIVLQRREWEGAHDERTIRRNYFYPRDYEALAARELILVDGDHDLLGDGILKLLFTPGHTPGHQSVMAGGRLVIGADVAHFSATFDDERFPAWADDYAAQGRSAARLRAMRDSGITVVPGHDPDVLIPGVVEVPTLGE